MRTRQTSENLITGRKYVVQTRLTGKIELVLLQNEWISLFSHGTFQRYVFMLFTRFVWTSGNGLSHKTWSHLLFAQHLEAYVLIGLWWTCLRYDIFPNSGNWRINLWNCAITLCKKRPSCDRVIKQGLGNLSSQARW